MKRTIVGFSSMIALAIAGCGEAQAGTLEGAGTPAAPAAAAAAAVTCTTGTWSVVEQDTTMPAVRYQTAHFAIRYNNTDLTTAAAQTLGTQLELTWSLYMGTIGFPEPYCGSATKYKVNVNVRSDFGLNGGIDGAGHMGVWLSIGATLDHFGLAHEFTHALQGSTGSFQNSPYVGSFWETHANFMATQLPEYRNFAHCSVLLEEYPHVYYGSSRNNYCSFQLLEYLKDKYGYGIVNNLWANAPKAGNSGQTTADVFSVMMSNQGWTVSQMNDAIGDWAMHNANWDYHDPDGTDHGAVLRADYGDYTRKDDAHILASTILDPMNASLRRYSVPSFWAPQRLGYNLVRLYPDAGATSVTVAFRGLTQASAHNTTLPGLANEPSSVPAPTSGWRWGIVAVGSDGTSRYSALQKVSSGSLTATVQSTDKGVFLIVMGAPTAQQKIKAGQPWYSIYRYPWMVQFTNAQPEGFQPGFSWGTGGHAHSNGGGWVGPNATVASTAYVGPYARVISGTVSGNARIEDHAVVTDTAQVIGNGVIGGLTVLRGNTIVKDNAKAYTAFLGLGEYEQNIVLSGTAQNIGHAEQRGASFSSGMYYDFIDQAAATDPTRGSQLTAPVSEVTATPNYVWY